MIFIIYSETDLGSLGGRLGAPEYSYWFVLREFRTVLERMGLVVFVRDPAREVDRLYRQFRERGEPCVFLCFEPPHKVPLGLACPTIPVFAWEFETLPDEDWAGDPRSDWRYVLNAVGRAITHSEHCVRVTRAAMGHDYPVACIPAPVWDGFARQARPGAGGPSRGRRHLRVRGQVVDSRKIDLAACAPGSRPYPDHADPPSPQVTPPGAGPPEAGPVDVVLDGVVYCSVFNPSDMRKNWHDMIAGFVCALCERPDATLVLKLTHRDNAHSLRAMQDELSRHAPFRCRVVLIAGFLDDDSYDALVAGTTFVVNASHGEGQCLPLMEFMSAGKPAIAPRNTAMADYVDERCAFALRSSREPCAWPHDDRELYRTLRWRIDFGTLVAAYADSYRVAVAEPARYLAMSVAAQESLRRHCSRAVV